MSSPSSSSLTSPTRQPLPIEAMMLARAEAQAQQSKAQEVPVDVEGPKTQSIMERPRPYTRRFHLDRPDLEGLMGTKGVARLRSKIPQTVIETERKAFAA